MHEFRNKERAYYFYRSGWSKGVDMFLSNAAFGRMRIHKYLINRLNIKDHPETI